MTSSGRGAVLLTGAAGFIGSHVAERLLDSGRTVLGLDNFDPFYPRAVKERNVAALRGRPGFQLVEGDIRDQESLRTLIRSRGVVEIVHLAARAGVRPSVADPELYADVNVRGTAALFAAAQAAGVRRIVYASSSSVYGAGARPPFREEDVVDRPLSPYAATKRANELQAAVHHHLYGTTMVGLRFFTAYGPRQRPEMAIHRFARLIAAGRPVTIYGDGSQQRDFTYVDDIVQGTVAALDAPAGCRIYNLGESRTTTVSAVVALLAAALDRPAQVEFRAPEPGDVPLTCADVTRARAELGYHPAVPLEDGIARFVAWFRESQRVYGADEEPRS